VVVSPQFDPEPNVLEDLEARDCTVIHRYLEAVEEIYQLADCYLFSTVDPSFCIEMPLSIMEAMACNLAVVTTPFGAVSRQFREVSGLHILDRAEDLSALIGQLELDPNAVRTRDAVEGHTWAWSSAHLVERYEEVLAK